MLNSAIIRKKITQDGDLDKLRKIASGILGEPCWQASLSYGDELSLDIGASWGIGNWALGIGHWARGARTGG